MRKRFIPVILAIVTLAGPAIIFAQQDTNKSAAVEPSVWHYYKLNFVLKEMDQGKVVNQRAFTLSATLNPPKASYDRSSVRAGTRMLMPGGEKGMEYVDIGTNIDAYKISEVDNGVNMFVSAEISSLPSDTTPSTPAALRQVRATASVVATLGKSTLVFSADDPASKHRFELDVTPVRER